MPEDGRLVIPLPHTFAWSIHVKVIIVILEQLRTLAPLCFAQPSYVYVYVSIVYHRIDVYRGVARRVRVRVRRENRRTLSRLDQLIDSSIPTPAECLSCHVPVRETHVLLHVTIARPFRRFDHHVVEAICMPLAAA
jgi:hypothetical protein